MINLDTFLLLIPPLSLIVLATWVIVASAFQQSRWWAAFCAVVMVIIAFGMWRQDAAIWQGTDGSLGGTDHIAAGPIFVDAFGHIGRWIAMSLALLYLPLVACAAKHRTSGEFLGVTVLAFAGLMIVAVSADMTLLLLGLELISIPTYVVLFLSRSDQRSSEATAKYFFLSILSSALFLYGLSFVYGAAGSNHLMQVEVNLQRSPDAIGLRLLPLGVVLLLVGLGFKVAAVPFQFYAPDVYQSSTHGTAGLLAVLPKIAGMLALMRISVAVSPAAASILVPLVIVISVASMTYGNVCALWQQDLRRMLAYSSIAHAGYMLIGLAAAMAAIGSQTTYDGLGATFFYMIVYSAGSLGAFAVLAYLSNETEEVNTLDQLRSLPNRHPLAAALLAVFMFSLSGIPPLAGFWGKMTLFTSALAQTSSETAFSSWFVALLLAAALNAAIAAAYYLRVIARMYFTSGTDEAPSSSYGVSFLPGITALACGLLVVLGGLRAGPIIQHAQQAGKSATGGSPVYALRAGVASQPNGVSDN